MAELWLALHREHLRGPSRQVRATRRNRELAQSHLRQLATLKQVWVLASRADVLGYAAAVPNLSPVEMCFSSAAVTDLYLRPEWRGKGWGRRLLRRALADIRRRGLDAVTISVAHDSPARNLYTAEGFTPWMETLLQRFDGPVPSRLVAPEAP
ncbi:MAG: GNAT family N-acetyltransferase [Candidatus Sericytochromatia bacterium]|nr:GNAT family N-acetyltransferase [Candidatus Sericytochromatia bacterium]